MTPIERSRTLMVKRRLPRVGERAAYGGRRASTGLSAVS